MRNKKKLNADVEASGQQEVVNSSSSPKGKINFKSAKYIMPLLVLPFTFIIIGVLKGNPKSELDSGLVTVDGFNSSLPDPSTVSADPPSKLSAMSNNLSSGDGSFLSGLSTVDELVEDDFQLERYSEKEIRELDSLMALSKFLSSQDQSQPLEGVNKFDFKSLMGSQGFATGSASGNTTLGASGFNSADPSQAYRAAMAAANMAANQYASSGAPPAPVTRSEPAKSPAQEQYEFEMRAFREQMALMDSVEEARARGQELGEKLAAEVIAQAMKPSTSSAPQKQASQSLTVQHVAKRQAANPGFNTLRGDRQHLHIKAILDEGLSVRDGGRIRLRLLDDIYVGDVLVEKGQYLYAIVSGFKPQRLQLKITSVMLDDEPYPISLSVYDNDGMAGLYVPQSDFRDLTKEMGSEMAQSSGQSLMIQQNPNSVEGLFSTLGFNAAQNSTRALSRAIRRNKADLKYGTIVYLVSE